MAASSRLEDLQRAADLFGGEFLAGLVIGEEGFDEWLQVQRNRIGMTAGRVLAACAEGFDTVGSGSQAIAAAERLIALDPLREDWQRLALRLCARYRGQHDALAQAKTFEALLRRELNVDPEPETATLVERIRRGEFALRAPPAGEPEPAASRPLVPAPEATTGCSDRAETERSAGTEESDAEEEIRRTSRWGRPFAGLHARGKAVAFAVATLALFAGGLALVSSGTGRLSQARIGRQGGRGGCCCR